MKTVQQKKNRQDWLDAARALGIVLVVLCHSVETYYRPVLLGQKRIGMLPWLAENFMFFAGRMGVPIFLCISGVLLLEREHQVRQFYKRSLLPLVATTELWIVLNYLFVCSPIKNHVFRMDELIREMLFLKEQSLSHMWYMPMIIGIYIAVPFLAKLLCNWEDIVDFKLIYLLGTGIFIIVPTVKVFLTEALSSLPNLSVKLDGGFWGGCYGLYLVGGFFIVRKKVLAPICSSILSMVAVVALAFNTVGQYYLYSHKFFATNGLYWYNDIAIFLNGLILFEFLRRFLDGKKIKGKTFLEYISRCSFGIYLLHKPLLVLVEKYLPLEGMHTLIKVGILFTIGMFGSMLVTMPFYYRWKKTGRILFHIK